MRKVHTKRYNKQVPGHHIQMDVKFLTFTGKCGEKIRRFLSNCIQTRPPFGVQKRPPLEGGKPCLDGFGFGDGDWAAGEAGTQGGRSPIGVSASPEANSWCCQTNRNLSVQGGDKTSHWNAGVVLSVAA